MSVARRKRRLAWYWKRNFSKNLSLSFSLENSSAEQQLNILIHSELSYFYSWILLKENKNIFNFFLQNAAIVFKRAFKFFVIDFNHLEHQNEFHLC